MLALYGAEYLVFMRRGDLRDDQRKRIGKLRGQRWTGAEISRDVRQVGSLPGMDYVAQLWELCVARTGSTFDAFYSFTQYWDSDIGGGHGWHAFPLRAVDREGDIVSWHIVWRQARYLAIIAQLTSMSPVILSAFLSGSILQ